MSPGRQAGFSLLEVLVAFAILAVSLGVLMEIFSRASIASVATAQYSRAASLVESKLNAVGTEIPVEEDVLRGESEDGFEWELTITPIELEETSFFEPPASPYRVNATALWQESGRVRRLTLSTLRLGERL